MRQLTIPSLVNASGVTGSWSALVLKSWVRPLTRNLNVTLIATVGCSCLISDDVAALIEWAHDYAVAANKLEKHLEDRVARERARELLIKEVRRGSAGESR